MKCSPLCPKCWTDRLIMSVLILTILYEDLLIGEQVDELSQVWLVQVVGQADV